jgi:hypothetical protein
MSDTDASLGAAPRPVTDVPLSDPLGLDLPPGVHRLRSRSATSALRQRLERSGWATAAVDLVTAPDKASILEAIAHGLVFPTWVGRNWDALDDALRDLSWWPAGDRGRVIVIRGAGRMATSMPRDRMTLHDVLATATRRWAATGTPLVILLRR